MRLARSRGRALNSQRTLAPQRGVATKACLGKDIAAVGTGAGPGASCGMPTSDELREEADATDRLARLVSYAPDKAWLNEKAEALRRQAERQDQTGFRRQDPD
jgi:hypothetical protein